MEAFILYFVLFFPGMANPAASGNAPVESIPFSALWELSRTLTRTIPSLALIWYLITYRDGISAIKDERPRKRDIFPFAIGLPGLVLIGLGVSFFGSLLASEFGFREVPAIEAPADVSGWIVMIFSCLFTGYLEESYFRHYLLSWLERTVPGPVTGVAVSSFLFSVCHIYEGPIGFVNALLAGIFLSVIYIRYRSLNGIALAHGAYNMFVYVMGIFGA